MTELRSFWQRTHNLSVRFWLILVVTATLQAIAILWMLTSDWRAEHQLITDIEIHERINAAAYELEINTVEAALAVLKFAEEERPEFATRFASDIEEFQQFHEAFVNELRWADQLALAERAAEVHQEFAGLGNAILALEQRELTLSARLSQISESLTGLVDERGPVSEVSETVDSPEAGIAETQGTAVLELFSHLLGHVAVDGRFDDPHGQTAVQALRTRIQEWRSITATTSASTAEMFSLATEAADIVEELMGLRAESDATMQRFSDLRVRLDDILDKEIQVLSRQSLDDAFDLRSEAGQSTMAVFVYLSLIVVGIGFAGGLLHIKGVANPIAQLAKAAEKVRHGDLAVRTQLRRSDEIGALSHSFDEMAAALQTMRERNDRINGELEEKVAKRTEDLRAANLMLLSELEQKARAEEELRQASFEAKKANAAKSTFLANMSHELRTPLNAVLGFSEMIEGEMLGPLNNKHYLEYASLITKSGRHLLQIIDDLLDLSRIEAGRFELSLAPTDIEASINDTFRLLGPIANSNEVTIKTLIQSDLPQLLADRRRVDQVMINLVGNAIKFTPPQGRIVIRARCRRSEPAGMEITVFDTGPGIPKEELERVLDRFGRGTHDTARAGEGAGLGLAVTKGLVDVHDGRLSLVSRLGRGTAATIWFPADRVLTCPSSPATEAPSGNDAKTDEMLTA